MSRGRFSVRTGPVTQLQLVCFSDIIKPGIFYNKNILEQLGVNYNYHDERGRCYEKSILEENIGCMCFDSDFGFRAGSLWSRKFRLC